MSTLFLENARVIDPAAGLDRKANILIRAGKIAAVDPAEAPADAERFDLSGRIAAPGLIDLHVHLRQPGGEEDETIESGTLAAVAGGFTSIACCPNTQPPLDTQASVELVRQLALRARHCRVYPLCCISKNREGNELAELGVLFAAGAAGCTDDGAPVADAELMRGKKILLVDDVISTGESLKALEALVEKAGGTICGRMAILAEGDAQDREDLIYLEKLPLFNSDGTIKG